MTVGSRSALASVPFVVRGRVAEGRNQTPFGDSAPQARTTLDLDELVWPSHAPVPLADVPTQDIIDLLAGVGDWVRRDPDGILARARESLTTVSGASRPPAERSYAELWRYFDPDLARSWATVHVAGIETWLRTTLTD